MSEVVARVRRFRAAGMDRLMVIGFIVFWPIGLAILAYIIWSGRMGCSPPRYGNMQDWRDRASDPAGIASASAGSGTCSAGAIAVAA